MIYHLRRALYWLRYPIAFATCAAAVTWIAENTNITPVSVFAMVLVVATVLGMLFRLIDDA